MWFFRGRPWLLFLALMVCKLLPQAGTLHFAGKSCIEGIWIGIKLGYQSCWRCFLSWRVCQDDSEQGGRGHPQSTSFLCAQTTHLSSGLRFLAIFRLPQSFLLDSDIHPFASPPNYQACQAWGLRISPISSKVVHTLPESSYGWRRSVVQGLSCHDTLSAYKLRHWKRMRWDKTGCFGEPRSSKENQKPSMPWQSFFERGDVSWQPER